MSFSEIISALGIEEYPAELEEIYKNNEVVSNFDAKAIDALDEEYNVIGERKESLKACLTLIRENEALWKYTCAAAAYLSRTSHPDGFKLVLPKVDTEHPLCYYPALLLTMALPEAINNYFKRGFSKDEIVSIYKGFRSAINLPDASAIAQKYNWLRHYTSSAIFLTSLFSVTPRVLRRPLILLKNDRGDYKIMMTGGRYHRDGKVLGSAGYTDEDGAFDAEFSEDEIFYTGHEVIDSCVTKEVSSLRKSEWQVVIREGDGIAGIHIPRGADLSDERMKKSFREAFDIMKERYPDYNPKAVHCSSWLVCPKLAELQGANSNITRFVNTFIKYPIKSAGTELFGFAFPKKQDSYEELAEDTSLQRKIKAIYLSGEFIHAHAGFVPEEYFL